MLPRRMAPYLYGALQAAITTGVATLIAALSYAHPAVGLMEVWLKPWLLAWLTMLPVVVLIAPIIQRAVVRLTYDDGPPRTAKH